MLIHEVVDSFRLVIVLDLEERSGGGALAISIDTYIVLLIGLYEERSKVTRNAPKTAPWVK